MKKLLTVVCLSGLLSVPSVVFAQEDGGPSWYGTLHTGITSAATAGVVDAGSKWGIRGSSEVSEGLTAVYQFEQAINAAGGTWGSGRVGYVGLSGGFGTLLIGQNWSASYNSVGAITDNSSYFGDAETSVRHGNLVSYAVSVENIDIQVDLIMNNGGGTTGGTFGTSMGVEDKNVDAFELGVGMGLGENGRIAFAHKSYDAGTWVMATDTYTGDDPDDDVTIKSNYIAGQYSIGGMTAYLGFAQHKGEDKTQAYIGKQTDKTTFAGIRGSIADTGVSYLFQARSKKTKGNTVALNEDSSMPLPANKHTPWVINLSRSLGGGASVIFEHGNPDQTGVKSSSRVALSVSF